jgi:hypothetical protein
MLHLIALLIGVVIGLLRGGRLSHLAQLKLRSLWFVGLSLVIQLLIFPLFSDAPLVPYATVPLHLLSYGLLIVWLAINLRRLPIGLLLIGAACNLIALASNGGRIPVSTTALERAGLGSTAERLLQEGVFGNGVRMGASTHVNVLGDWLYLPAWVPAATAFSIGDLLVAVGLAWLVARGMKADG